MIVWTLAGNIRNIRNRRKGQEDPAAREEKDTAGQEGEDTTDREEEGAADQEE
jgi:hypothetical protein